jgi:hypothetical protein
MLARHLAIRNNQIAGFFSPDDQGLLLYHDPLASPWSLQHQQHRHFGHSTSSSNS